MWASCVSPASKARDVAQAVLGKLPKPRYADYLPFNDVDGTPLDQGIALWFPGPNSFTGEDVLELQGHGARSFSTCCSNVF